MPSANGQGPKQAVLSTCDSSEGSKFYRHNRARLLTWLRYYADHHEPGYSQGVPDFREMQGYGSCSPLNSYRLKRLDDEEVYRCHRILTRSVDKLQHERWRLYEGLLPVYFSDDPSPTILDRWHEGALDPPAARLALAAHDEAVEFMHAHVEQELSRHGLKRLKVNVPCWWTPGAKPHSIEPEHVEVLEAYYGYLETNDTPTAVCKAAEETGYAAESARKLVRQAEGVLTTSLSQRYHATRKKLLEVDGLKLSRLRRERARSQADLERMSGVAQSTISALEGSRQDAQPRTVRKLAEALSIEPRQLVKGD